VSTSPVGRSPAPAPAVLPATVTERRRDGPFGSGRSHRCELLARRHGSAGYPVYAEVRSARESGARYSLPPLPNTHESCNGRIKRFPASESDVRGANDLAPPVGSHVGCCTLLSTCVARVAADAAAILRHSVHHFDRAVRLAEPIGTGTAHMAACPRCHSRSRLRPVTTAARTRIDRSRLEDAVTFAGVQPAPPRGLPRDHQ
jgi:hypothetical protein